MALEMPGTRPCECEHEYSDHELAGGGCHMCKCERYRPIPRSELRKRQFERGREEAEAKASEANKSERKSQVFPTAPEPGHRFWVDQQATFTEANVFANGMLPFAIVVAEFPVVDNRPGGQGVYMTYKSRQGAENGLARARIELPEARIAEYENGS